MKIITAPEKYDLKENEISVFLAGGITNCEEWQNKIIDYLKDNPYNDLNDLVVFNPRRENFPIDDKSAAQEQIEWEFNNIERCDIFSIYFCGGISDQPICMYELGRNILRLQNRFPANWQERIVISIEEEYKRKDDVIIQTRLATNNITSIAVGKEKEDDLISTHADRIIDAYLIVRYIL